VTELLLGGAEVRLNPDGEPAAIRRDGRWLNVIETALVWRVETDWWRVPVCRDYFRCLLAGGECVEVFRNLTDGSWHWARRYD
jgi:hypothetical protein